MSDVSDLASALDLPPEHVLIAGGTVASAFALRKVLGPSLDAIGNALGDFSAYRLRNLFSIGEKVRERYDSDPDPSDSTIHPRVAKALLEEGSWLDDEVAQEYFAGMLIGASKDATSEGDNAYFARLAASLSSDQLRLHHIFYSSLQGLGEHIDLRTNAQAEKVTAFFDLSDVSILVPARRIGPAATILSREELIGEYACDPVGTVIQPWLPWVPGPGIAFRPTSVGAQLFLKAYGFDVAEPNHLPHSRTLPHVRTDMPSVSQVTFAPGVRLSD